MANYNSITDFIGAFGGGYRPNRFMVNGKVGTVSETLTFHIKAASLPASSISTIMVPYRGRNFKMPGNRTYTPWQITVLDDNETEGTALWGRFHDWSNKINDHLDNITNAADLNFGDQLQRWNIYQLDINGAVSKQIDLINCWPAEVGPIILNMDDNETLSTFTVTLEYSHYDIVKHDTKTGSSSANPRTNTPAT